MVHPYNGRLSHAKNELLIHTTRMHLKSIMLSERSKKQTEVHILCFHLTMWNPGKGKTLVSENGSVVARAEGGRGGLTAEGHQRTFRDDGNVLCLDCAVATWV